MISGPLPWQCEAVRGQPEATALILARPVLAASRHRFIEPLLEARGGCGLRPAAGCVAGCPRSRQDLLDTAGLLLLLLLVISRANRGGGHGSGSNNRPPELTVNADKESG